MSRFERLSVLDELFLHLEGPDTHMHVGGAAIFEGPPPDYEEVLDMVRGRLQLVPRFRQKLMTVPFGLGRPVWVDDTHFNLEYHVRHTALPSPGDDSKFRRLTARIMSQQLDRTKPLWEIWFAEGLTNDRFALISKTHHCLVDGVSGADIMSVILDLGPEPQQVEPKAWRPDPEPTPDQLLLDALRERLTSPAEIVRTLQSSVIDPGKIPNRLIESVRALASFVGGTLDFAPTSSLNQPIGPHRRFETVLVELAEIKRIKNALDGTVHDVVHGAAERVLDPLDLGELDEDRLEAPVRPDRLVERRGRREVERPPDEGGERAHALDQAVPDLAGVDDARLEGAHDLGRGREP
ncbi:MAG TPA: wax ester/triacylglycerol synthase domain-containing protein, partial [Actinomycetota bacterium]|nr:wax ester/triacylglycerol synthase domain-containing protein [Actinomycetota bacterium]